MIDTSASPLNDGVSIVIPAFNEEKYLPETLRALNLSRARLELTGVPTEIIVVDNASTDKTSVVASNLGCLVIAHPERNISAVRNAGIKAARYGLVVTIDADCSIGEDGLEKIISHMASGIHVGGAMNLRVHANRWDARIAIFLIQWFVVKIAGINGALFFFWKDDALAFGGFREDKLIAEDSAFALDLRRHGAKTNRTFSLLKSVMVTTTDRKDTSIAMLLLLVPKLLRVFLGASVKKSDLKYWYEPKR